MSAGYRLGVDLGTTFTAAAMARDGSYQMVRLASERFEIPSTVCLAPDGQIQLGESREQLAEQYPSAVARDVKRRMGDAVALMWEGPLDLAELEDPDILRSMAALRGCCVRAKEELSSKRSVAIEADLQGRSMTVRITRGS